MKIGKRKRDLKSCLMVNAIEIDGKSMTGFGGGDPEIRILTSRGEKEGSRKQQQGRQGFCKEKCILTDIIHGISTIGFSIPSFLQQPLSSPRALFVVESDTV